MMWLLAALIVLAMGGVAMLAAGHGAPLRDDSATSTTPPRTGEFPGEWGLDAAALRRVRFSVVARGYRMSEVDDLLDRLAAERERERPPAKPTSSPESSPSPDDPFDRSGPPDQGGATTST